MKSFSRVLAAVDFSKPARGAFEHALALSQRHGAELVVVHAVLPSERFGAQGRERLALTTELRQRAEQANVKFFDRVQQGDPAEIILLHARALRPNVIVVGTHQRRGIDRVRAGSVAERVAAKVTVPVLLVPMGQPAATVEGFRHVAVAVDLHAGSSGAIEQALAWATDPTDRVTLLHVVPGSSAGVPPHLYRYGLREYHDQLIRDARQRLQRAVAVNRSRTAAIDTRVLVGNTATEVNRAIDSIGADLLVVSVPTRSVMSRALFGSTTTRLLKAIRVPMLAVPDVNVATSQDERTSVPLAA